MRGGIYLRRLRKSTKQYIIVTFLSLLAVGTSFVVAYILIVKNIKIQYGVELEAKDKEIKANEKYVYIATQDIVAGTTLTEELLEYKKVVTSQEYTTFLQKGDLMRTALVPIPKGVYIVSNMVSDQQMDDTLRECELECIKLSSRLDINDTIDLRICYPNGENYIVLSKVLIQNYIKEQNICYFWLREEETIRVSSAIVDAYLYPGAYLYATKYIQPELQTASIVTYQASLSIQELIRNNPNIIEVAQTNLSQTLRKALENRLSASLNMDVTNIEWRINYNNKNTKQEDASSIVKQQEETHFYYSNEMDAKEKDIEYGE